ncbi:MAG: metallophosphoesterase [Christensenellaceae bacterium]|jgi:3',5'-cyclic AMP phosphodiesterase CpdA|nr:metallophosphoesterase [Christensenellaceae bacterium]
MNAIKTKRPRRRKGDWGRIILKITLILVATLVIATTAGTVVATVGYKANFSHALNLDPVVKENVLVPEIDEETGYWTFTTDEEFKILQLTDTHFGGGFVTVLTDLWAINAIRDMVTYVKPDLVIITGNMIYSDFFRTTNLNNMTSTKLFVQAMESLGVYWAVAFGNHDSDSYAFYDRKTISDYYESAEHKYCLYMAGPDDIFGYGNYIINVKRTDGVISQSIVLVDSNSYITGFTTNYDNIHDDQITWYKKEILRLNELNKEKGEVDMIKSLLFFHIPLYEYRTAWYEYVNAGYSDTENVKYNFGKAGETGVIVYSAKGKDAVFETVLYLGSTQGIFTGHDHLNNFSIDYNGGSGTTYIRLTYSLSIDYIAYVGIYKKTAQRGGTVITTYSDGEYDCDGLRLVDKAII